MPHGGPPHQSHGAQEGASCCIRRARAVQPLQTSLSRCRSQAGSDRVPASCCCSEHALQHSRKFCCRTARSPSCWDLQVHMLSHALAPGQPKLLQPKLLGCQAIDGFGVVEEEKVAQEKKKKCAADCKADCSPAPRTAAAHHCWRPGRRSWPGHALRVPSPPHRGPSCSPPPSGIWLTRLRFRSPCLHPGCR